MESGPLYKLGIGQPTGSSRSALTSENGALQVLSGLPGPKPPELPKSCHVRVMDQVPPPCDTVDSVVAHRYNHLAIVPRADPSGEGVLAVMILYW